MLETRPLTTTDRDAALRAGPDVSAKVAGHLKLGASVLLSGPAGSGKTTAAYQVADLLDGGVVHLPHVETRDELLAALEVATDGAPVEAALEATLSAEPRTLIMDAPGVEVAGAFGRWRDVWWSSGVRWLVVVRDVEVDRWLAPPADTFFDHVQMPSWSKTDLTEVLRRRYDGLSDEEIGVLHPLIGRVAEAATTPAAALRLARQVLTAESPESVLMDAVEANNRAMALSEVHGRVWRELGRQGGGSASDEGLQRIGNIGRSRLVQILGELQDEGLVDKRRDGRRVVYYVPGAK